MNKEEILKKAQEENKDELRQRVYDKSMYWCVFTMAISSCFFSYILNKEILTMEICATLMFSVFSGNLYRYIKMKNKSDLKMGICSLFVAICATILFFTRH